MRKIALSVILLLSVTMVGCVKSDDDNGTSILNIDGAEVPFLQGQEAIADALGDKYADWTDFTFPEGVNPDDVALILCNVISGGEENQAYEILSYGLNDQEGELENFDIEIMGFDLKDFSVDEFKDKYGEYVYKGTFCDCQIVYAEGGFVKSEDSQGVMMDRFVNGEIDSYMVISIWESDDGGLDEIHFTVTDVIQKQ